jgi:two-component system, NarL family, sensor histidine kinase BarA
MSYRAFKRLLGETSLERKCRFLFGTATLLLISASFLWYARQTEFLAYEQVTTTGRLLVNLLLFRMHDKLVGSGFHASVNDISEEYLPDYQYWLIKPKARKQENQASDDYERKLVQEFLADGSRLEESHPMPSQPFIYYYGAVRASESCLTCHPTAADKETRIYHEGLKDGDLMALVKIRLSTDAIQAGINQNRAWLLSTALVTAILIMFGSYLIVRYIIVKPVKHLKEVSDAISAGELNVRSEIQTGDEFEDLSHAFNRMLRNLVSMQDRLRKANGDLDLKVDELARVNMALYDSNRLKSDFLATMSHELRTPLNSIIGFSDVLASGEPLTDKQQRWVGNIRKSGEQLLNLINDILDLAKIEAGKMQIRPEEFSIRDVCEGLLNMFRPMAEKKNIELRDQIAADIPLLHQDAGKLQQILSNLLSNAIKFTPEGGRVTLRAEAEGLYVLLTVADTGVGIAPEDQELVFEKFRQAGNPLTREHAGTGLGLSIVRELSKLLGGEVTLQSELGRGSTFTVRLPLQIPQEPRLDLDLALRPANEAPAPEPVPGYNVGTGDAPRPRSGSNPEMLPITSSGFVSAPMRTEPSEHLS